MPLMAILVTNVRFGKLNRLSLHYSKVPIMAEFSNGMKEIKIDRYLKELIDSRQNGFIKV